MLETRFPNNGYSYPDYVKDAARWMKYDLRLRDIEIKMPYGRLIKSDYDDFFIGSFKPGTMSGSDCNLDRALNLRDAEIGITKAILIPRRSYIEFEFEGIEPKHPPFEIFYSNNRVDYIESIEQYSMVLNVIADRKGLLLRGNSSLNALEERFRTGWSILQGTELVLRAILEDKILTLNLISDKALSTIEPLFERKEDILPLLQSLLTFLGTIPNDQFPFWRRAVHFYLEGIGRHTSLEVRSINLFVFLEMIDKEKQLTKHGVNRLLNIELHEADLLCKIRNMLIHGGESLGAAVIKADTELKKYTPFTSKLFEIYPRDEETTAAAFYFSFTALLGKLWAKLCGYSGSVNSYKDLIDDIKGRHIIT